MFSKAVEEINNSAIAVSRIIKLKSSPIKDKSDYRLIAFLGVTEQDLPKNI